LAKVASTVGAVGLSVPAASISAQLKQEALVLALDPLEAEHVGADLGHDSPEGVLPQADRVRALGGVNGTGYL